MSTFYQLDFERPVRELEQQIEAAELRLKAGGVAVAEPGAEPIGVPPGVMTEAIEASSPDDVPADRCCSA